MEWVLTIAAACIGSTGLFSLVQYCLNRKDKNKVEIEKLRKEVKSLQIDINGLRLQNLMQNTPENKDTILRAAEDYFIKLGGDGYLADLFYDWAEKQKVDIGWFRGKIK